MDNWCFKGPNFPKLKVVIGQMKWEEELKYKNVNDSWELFNNPLLRPEKSQFCICKDDFLS